MRPELPVDAVRLAVGTLTILPTRAPQRVDSVTWGRAMKLAPIVGLVLGVLAWVLAWGVQERSDSTLLASTCAVGALAVLTRGLHLDGLADVADGLGSRKSPEEARAIMRRSDIGPFGVVVVVLTLFLQIAAIQVALNVSAVVGALAVVGGAAVSRTALTAAARRGVPAASDGLGSSVIGSVSPVSAASLCGVVVAALGVAGAGDSARTALCAVTAALVALFLAEWWRRHCVRRMGAVTGDVLGSIEELAFTTLTLLLALMI
ncbi:MAG: adenosylcobinamide-GDP ribazoletransferase [Actinomycetes bacterium]